MTSWSEADAALFAAVLGRDAARHLAATPPHVDAPATAALAPDLQARLHDLVEQGGGVVWAYAIFWQESGAVLGWGDGHCRDGGEAAECSSTARKRVLLRLHALYGGGGDDDDDEEGADYALRWARRWR
ncbi:hypothetical protein QOZ80_1BG0080380 [Eleusine coracana subsp. coracana]|nr:hypothetical protein QOZ80_1BG0080380 [Eleusine coracana subsp. coracana]